MKLFKKKEKVQELDENLKVKSKIAKSENTNNIRILYPAALIFCLIIGIVSTYDRNNQSATKYEQALSKARSCVEDGLIDKGLELYDEALQIENSAKINIERANVLLENDRSTEAINYIEEKRAADASEGSYYKFLFEEYINENKIEEFYLLYKKAERAGVIDEEIQALEESVAYDFYLGDNMYEDVGEFRGGYCAVSDGEHWGYVDYAGNEAIELIYQSAGAFQSEQASVQAEDGNWYYVDVDGVRVEKTTEADANSYVWSGVQVLQDADGYYLADSEGNPYEWTDKDSALPERFEDVAVDMYGMSLYNDRVFVKYDGVYHMVTSEGQIIDTKFEISDAKPFQDIDGLAAVCTGNDWGLMDKDGTLVVEQKYEDARSSCSGYAGVMTDEFWGFVNTSGEEVISPMFEDIRDMSPSTTGFVKVSGGWRTLSFYKVEVLGE
ncbi:MAG: WG repeat-containing protein [Lachnospiraceae bacterium]|nr:WG repeat-containing protein [Lachnospiraceae bacterium]